MEDRCICCGEVIPEGRMVCPSCESGKIPAKNTRPVENNGQYVVVVTNDRELVEVKPIASLEAGVDYANELLNEILEENGLNYIAGLETGEWHRATTENLNAWCNFCGAWDAFVAKL